MFIFFFPNTIIVRYYYGNIIVSIRFNRNNNNDKKTDELEHFDRKTKLQYIFNMNTYKHKSLIVLLLHNET